MAIDETINNNNNPHPFKQNTRLNDFFKLLILEKPINAVQLLRVGPLNVFGAGFNQLVPVGFQTAEDVPQQILHLYQRFHFKINVNAAQQAVEARLLGYHVAGALRGRVVVHLLRVLNLELDVLR